MEARGLYSKLENDFDLKTYTEESLSDWTSMDYNEFISDNFRKRHMGASRNQDPYPG